MPVQPTSPPPGTPTTQASRYITKTTQLPLQNSRALQTTAQHTTPYRISSGNSTNQAATPPHDVPSFSSLQGQAVTLRLVPPGKDFV